MVMVDARIFDVIRACLHDANIVESVARSCYLQGLIDGTQVAQQCPDTVKLLWGRPEA
jgi:hypothetical protein